MRLSIHLQAAQFILNRVKSDDEVIFEIKDENWHSLEDQQRLFESFHRATNVKNIPGTGLGPTIVKRCIDIYNGNVNVSEVGVGTTFTVTLPLQR